MRAGISTWKITTVNWCNMFIASIEIKDKATKGLITLYGLVQDRKGFVRALGYRGVSVLKKWFKGLDASKPNKKGWPRLHFWDEVANSVKETPKLDGASAIVSVMDPRVAHKAGLGPNAGVIRPVNAEWLTIPAVPEAYGKTAKEFTGRAVKTRRLIFIKRSEATALLGQVIIIDGKKGPRGGDIKSLRVIFILKKFVHQKPDPDTLPDDETWRSNLVDEGQSFILTELRALFSP